MLVAVCVYSHYIQRGHLQHLYLLGRLKLQDCLLCLSFRQIPVRPAHLDGE